MNHVVETGHGAVFVGDDVEIHDRVLRLVDVADPPVVLMQCID